MTDFFAKVLDAAADELAGDEKARALRRLAPYADDPAGFFADVIGDCLHPPALDLLEAILRGDRYIVAPAGNNLGKSHLIGGLIVWYATARGARLGNDGRPVGARVLLPGPDLSTIRQTSWAQAKLAADKAEHRGYKLPGKRYMGRSDSTLWEIGPSWNVEALSPPKRAEGEAGQAHGAAGRHHENMIFFVEEALGISRPLWETMIGSASGAGNQVVAVYNPYDPKGATSARLVSEVTRQYGMTVVTLSALEHPNVVSRRPIVPAAISHEVVDAQVKNVCEDLGPYPATLPDARKDDFIYALPPADTAADAPRADGRLGHRDGELRVYRPKGKFGPRFLGRQSLDERSGLIDPADVRRSVDRWLAGGDPEEPPARIGLDAAEGGRDEIIAAPAWGDDADALLADYLEALVDGNASHLEHLCTERRIRIGQLLALEIDDRAPAIAQALHGLYPSAWWIVEDIGDGKSVIDHARSVLGHATVGLFNPQGSPPSPLHEEPLAGNLRAAAYVRLSMLLTYDLIDLPPDPELERQLLVMELEHRAVRYVKGERRSVAYLPEKRKLKRLLGASPDRADAVAFATRPAVGEEVLFGDEVEAAFCGEGWEEVELW